MLAIGERAQYKVTSASSVGGIAGAGGPQLIRPRSACAPLQAGEASEYSVDVGVFLASQRRSERDQAETLVERHDANEGEVLIGGPVLPEYRAESAIGSERRPRLRPWRPRP